MAATPATEPETPLTRKPLIVPDKIYRKGRKKGVPNRPKVAGLSYDKSKALWVVTRGLVLRVDGSTRPNKFYLGRDLAQANIKRAIIEAEWERLKQNGGKVWTEEAFRRLAEAGVIRPKKPVLKKTDALATFRVDPLTEKQTLPFIGEEGLTPDQGYALADLTARKFLSQPGVRGALWEEWERAFKDGRGWEMVKEIMAAFDMTKKEAAALFQLNFGGNGGTVPIAFDASKNRNASNELYNMVDSVIDKDNNANNDKG